MLLTILDFSQYAKSQKIHISEIFETKQWVNLQLPMYLVTVEHEYH